MNAFIFFSVFISIFGAVNFYIGLRLFQFLSGRLTFLNGKVYWMVYFIIVIGSFIGFAVSKSIPYVIRSAAYLLGSYWLAAIVYFTLILAFIDLVRLINRWLSFIPSGLRNNSDATFALGLFVIGFVALLLTYGTWNARNIHVTPYEVTIPKSACPLQDLHIVMLSDLHLGSMADHREKNIVEVINSLNPDIVLIPGDFIENVESFDKQEMAQEFKKINSKYGVYATFGNHDFYNGNAAYLTEQLSRAGVKVLRDSTVKLADSFYIVGREEQSFDAHDGRKSGQLSEMMQGLDQRHPIILLDHQPNRLEESKEAGVDLQLSGHTHKGQFFPFNFFTKRMYTVDYGFYQTGNLQVIVSSGAATWGPPIRIGSSSEVVDIKVRFGGSL